MHKVYHPNPPTPHHVLCASHPEFSPEFSLPFSSRLQHSVSRRAAAAPTPYSAVPTAWVAVWRSSAGAKPVISLGSDIDDIPQASNKPGVGYRDPLIAGAPGHGEGHNSGQPVNITAAIAVKKIMERERIPGTIHIWPGVAEEQLGSKAYYVREGVFKDVDAVLFSHVSDDLNVSWGAGGGLALISAEFSFKGQSAHAAGAPWRGRSALDA